MSYDVAIWAGLRPSSDKSATVEFERRSAVLDDESTLAPASPTLTAFVEELLTMLPPLDDLDDPASPWSVGPEPGTVTGDFAYLTMTYRGARAALDMVIEVARRYGLVCFDPQERALL